MTTFRGMTFNKNHSGVLWKGDIMKKLIGILSVFCILITSSNICLAARDVYVCTNNAGEDIYVDVDSIKGWSDEFQANVKIGKKTLCHCVCYSKWCDHVRR